MLKKAADHIGSKTPTGRGLENNKFNHQLSWWTDRVWSAGHEKNVSNTGVHVFTRWWFQRSFICVCLILLGEMIQFDEHIFHTGWNHHLVYICPLMIQSIPSQFDVWKKKSKQKGTCWRTKNEELKPHDFFGEKRTWTFQRVPNGS